MKYTLFIHIMIMGIQAYLFGKRFRKDKKHNECNQTNVEADVKLDNETMLHHQKIIELNKRLCSKYQELTEEQDYFERKRLDNTNIQEVLNSKKCEVENRLQYLEGIKNNVGEKFKDKTTSIQEFKNLCSMFVSTHNDMEKVQMEIHQSEIELNMYLQSWNDELLEHNTKISILRKDIESIMKEIEKYNECET